MAILTRDMLFRRLVLILIFFVSLAFLSPQNAFAQYTTCCDAQSYNPPLNSGNYGQHCNACDLTGKEWKSTGGGCGNRSSAECEVCSGSRPWANACGGSGGGGPTPAPVKRACGEACTTTNDCRNPSTGGFPVECRNGKCQLPLTGPYACAEGQSSGSICTCATKAQCGERCGPAAGNKQCNAGSFCGFITPSNACMVNGVAQTSKQYCLPVNPANGYGIRRCDITPPANYIAASTLVKPDGTQTGMTAADVTAACTAFCGDGITGPGEQCDLGSNNGVSGYTCSSSCTSKASCNDTCTTDTQCNAHQVTLRCENSATRRYCGLDAIIENGVKLEETSPRFTKAALWRVSTNVGFSGGNEIYASDNGATISFTTTASSVTLLQTKATNRGTYTVLIDGKPQPTKIDLYNGTTLFQQPVVIDLRGTDSPAYVCRSGACRLQSDPTSTSCTQAPVTPTPVPKVTISSKIEMDPSLTGGTAPTLIGGVVDGYCSSPSTGTSVSGGSIVAKDTANRSYPGTISGGTYTITNLPAANDEYCISYTPASSSIVCTCPVGCTYCGKDAPTTQNLKFYVSPVGSSWYQGVGGDIGAQANSGTGVIDPIPTTCSEPGCKPYLSWSLTNLSAGALITNRNSTVDLSDAAGTQTGNVAPTGSKRFAQLPTSIVCRENYEYFYRLYSMGINPTGDFAISTDARKPTTAPVNQKLAYFYGGAAPLIISTPWTLNSGESIVIFVNGNLNIANTITVPKGAFLAFIVSGNITVDPSVGTTDFASTTDGQVQGVYIATGQIIVSSVTGADVEKKFVGEGTFGACGGIRLPRDFAKGGNGLQNNKYPASFFVYRPDMVQNTPERMKTSTFNWQEVAP